MQQQEKSTNKDMMVLVKTAGQCLNAIADSAAHTLKDKSADGELVLYYNQIVDTTNDAVGFDMLTKMPVLASIEDILDTVYTNQQSTNNYMYKT